MLTFAFERPAAVPVAAERAAEWDPHFPGHRRLSSFDGHGNRLEFREPIAG